MKHNCLWNELRGYHVEEGQKEAPDKVNTINSDVIYPWYSGVPLSHHGLVLWQTSRHHRLLIYSFDRAVGACSSARASGKDQMWGLKKKKEALGCHRSKLPVSQDLKWDDTSNTQHTVATDVGPWPSSLARGVWNTDLFGWSSQQLSRAKGSFVKLGCQILKLTKKARRNHFGRADKNRKPN